jgi:GNAT superfamily N-acetyltransferase
VRDSISSTQSCHESLVIRASTQCHLTIARGRAEFWHNWYLMQLYIRDALESDVDDLIELLLGEKIRDPGFMQANRDNPNFVGDYLDAIRDISATNGNYLLVADLDGRAVAMVQLVTFRHFQHRGGRCAEIESMHVAPSHSDTDLGSQLLEYAASRARDLGCYRMQLTAGTKRQHTHKFFQDHGFIPTHVGYKQYLDLDWTPQRSAQLERPKPEFFDELAGQS